MSARERKAKGAKPKWARCCHDWRTLEGKEPPKGYNPDKLKCRKCRIHLSTYRQKVAELLGMCA